MDVEDIAALCLELEKLAYEADLPFLAYLLGLARTEALVEQLRAKGDEMKRWAAQDELRLRAL